MKPTSFLHGVIRTATAAGVLSAALLSLNVAALASENAEALAQEAWRDSIAHTSVPAPGCFEASYPSVEWNQVECVEAPNVQFLPRTGRAIGQTVGDGDDYAAEVRSGLISQTIGSFPADKDVKTESGVYGANSYSLQLNSNFMNTPACDGAKVPADCLDWLQYVYSSDFTSAFMQYWLINWNTTCPAGWNSYSGDCYTNSNAVTVPKEAISKLKTIKISGSAVSGGVDTLVMTVGTKAYSVTGEDSVVYLATAWKESEFNIIGDGGGSQANFNTGASVTVKIAVTNGTKTAPTCASHAGTTGETNNLNLGSCKGTSGTAPYIEFTESN